MLLFSQPTQPAFGKGLLSAGAGPGVGDSFPAHAVGGLAFHTPGERGENERQPSAEIAHSSLLKLDSHLLLTLSRPLQPGLHSRPDSHPVSLDFFWF